MARVLVTGHEFIVKICRAYRMDPELVRQVVITSKFDTVVMVEFTQIMTPDILDELGDMSEIGKTTD